ncbi:MAG TPA: phage head closure protein [Pseudolabrys sp.]|nr:phage head closure protein [Pseudolabrys sp.]
MTAPLKDIGALDRRLTLEAPAETPDGAGGVTRGYADEATLWAQVTPLSARADVVAQGAGAALCVRIVIRARAGISTRHRLRDGTRLYRIVAWRESENRRFLDIDAEAQEY